MACSWGKGSESRCGQRGVQELPGNTSFRQDWPIRLCEETDCETEAGDSNFGIDAIFGQTSTRLNGLHTRKPLILFQPISDETVVSSDWNDPCDEALPQNKDEKPPGPLEQFDERVRKFLEGDIWLNPTQPHMHRSLMPQYVPFR